MQNFAVTHFTRVIPPDLTHQVAVMFVRRQIFGIEQQDTLEFLLGLIKKFLFEITLAEHHVAGNITRMPTQTVFTNLNRLVAASQLQQGFGYSSESQRIGVLLQ
ncbi:MAG: hypothetical protein ALAOOOJD_01982 [bacterium]|nr:hypothetical protein [bacterium]